MVQELWELAPGAHSLEVEWKAGVKNMFFLQLNPDQGDAYGLLPEEKQVLVGMM